MVLQTTPRPRVSCKRRQREAWVVPSQSNNWLRAVGSLISWPGIRTDSVTNLGAFVETDPPNGFYGFEGGLVGGFFFEGCELLDQMRG